MKLLPEKPDAILLAYFFQEISRLGMILSTLEPSVFLKLENVLNITKY
jgi:hypothetical protein